MVYDYLGLGDTGITRQPKAKRLSKHDDGYLNMSSDYLGLGKFAHENAKDVHKARGFVKREVQDYKTAYKEIRGEVKAFKNDVGRGGWIGDYIRRKQLAKKQSKPKKFSNKFY